METQEKHPFNRPWIAWLDDERAIGNSIIVTLAKDWDFANEPGCGVQGFDTMREARAGTAKSKVVKAR